MAQERHTGWMEPRNVARRLERLEGIVLALVGKVRKMANGLEGLQDSIGELGRGLKAALGDLVGSHDTGDNEGFEENAARVDDLVNQLQNLGSGDNRATKAGQSPSPAVDLKQNAGPVSEGTGEGGSDDFH
jgi:hypothetical protein